MLHTNSGVAWVGRVGLVTAFAVLAATPAAVDAQGARVTFADPTTVEVVPGASAVEVVLEGEGLTAFTSGAFESGGRAVRGVRVGVSHGRDGRTRLAISADASVAGTDGQVVLSNRTTRLVVGGVAVRVAAPFEPVGVSTGTLSMTGRRFVPVGISTDGLSMTGRRFTPVTISAPALSMTGRRDTRGGSR